MSFLVWGINMAYIRYLRHRELSRLRHSKNFLNWLNVQAKRLNMTTMELFTKMKREQLSYLQVQNLKPVELPPVEGE